MQTQPLDVPQSPSEPSFGLRLAIVQGQLGPRSFRVQPVDSGNSVWAEFAALANTLPDVGDRVLIGSDRSGQSYIIGMLSNTARTAPVSPPDRLTTRDGASACQVGEGDDERLQIRDRNDRILFEYQPGAGKGVLSISAEDLRLSANRNIDLVAGNELRLFSARSASLEALGRVRIGSEAGSPDHRNTLSIDQAGTSIRTESLRCVSESADFSFGEGRLRGERFTVRLTAARLVVSRLETMAHTVIERATDAFRYIARLHQLKAGRARTLAEEGYSVSSKRVRLDGEESVKLQGDKIHLG